MALKLFYLLEKNFSKKPGFKILYQKQIKEYIENSHAKKLDKKEMFETSNITNYLPHHEVFNVTKPGQVRVIHYGSAKYQRTSLN